MTQEKLNKVSLVISNFTDTPKIQKLLSQLTDKKVNIFCYNCDNNMGYPVFFMNYILNTYDCDYIACDKLAAKKLDTFRRDYRFLDLENINIEEINID